MCMMFCELRKDLRERGAERPISSYPIWYYPQVRRLTDKRSRRAPSKNEDRKPNNGTATASVTVIFTFFLFGTMGDPTKKSVLFEDEDEDQAKIKVNKKFAKEYQQRKQKEELRKVKFDIDEDDDASTSSSEDEDGALLTKSMDVSILKTINALRRKEERIYDPNTRFFEENEDSDNSASGEDNDSVKAKKKTKQKRYKDVIREQILDQMKDGETNDDDDVHSSSDRYIDEDEDRSSRFAYDAEQKELRKAFISSSKDMTAEDAPESESEDDLMVVKKKSKADDSDDEVAQKQLEEELEKMRTASKDGTSKIVDPRGEVEDGDKFLLDFFKNRPWTNQGEDNDSLEDDSESGDDDVSFEALDEADDYEAQYNFRFEQASSDIKSGADLSIKSYARGQTMTTLRRKDETRREKRMARKERKAAERKAKEEELRRLKNAKRQEMEEKLSKVKAVLGDVGEDGGDAVDEATLLKLLEGDFDPEKFEELMKETYGDDFYEKKDTQWHNDQDVRASLKVDEDVALVVGQDGQDGDLYDDPSVDDNNDEDEEAEISGDYNDDEEEWMEEDLYQEEKQESTIERKIKEKMTDDLYKLDYEDIVAGMPTRFKYRQVEPNDYGLTTQEILFARDSALKQFVSLKKMAPYREDGEFFVGSRKRRRFRDTFQHEMEEEYQKESEKEEVVGEPEEMNNTKKRRRKRGKKKGGNEEDDDAAKSSEQNEEQKQLPTAVATSTESSEPKPKRRRRKKSSTEKVPIASEDKGPTKDSANKNAPEPLSSAPQTCAEERVSTEVTQLEKPEKEKKKKKSKKKKSKKVIGGVSESRFASYGL